MSATGSPSVSNMSSSVALLKVMVSSEANCLKHLPSRIDSAVTALKCFVLEGG